MSYGCNYVKQVNDDKSLVHPELEDLGSLMRFFDKSLDKTPAVLVYTVRLVIPDTQTMGCFCSAIVWMDAHPAMRNGED